MKKVILVTDTAPLYPTLWGGPKRIWSIYSNLSPDLFDITYAGVSFWLGRGINYRFTKIRDNLREILCAPPLHYYPWHVIEQKIFKNTSLDLFIYLFMHTDWQFKYVLNSQKADIVIFSHPWSSLCIKNNGSKLFIYDAHNCEYLLMNQILGKHPLKNLILRQVKKIEGDACEKSDLILVCSEKEKEDLRQLYRLADKKFLIVPNGTAIKPLPNAEEKEYAKEKLGLTGEKIIVFIGAYFKPNIEATEFIVNNLALKLSDFMFLIAGSVKDAFLNRALPGNVRFFGRVSDEELDMILKASSIALNPMSKGSGINIKMLDYFGYGLPIITTQCGSRGLEAKHMKEIFIAPIDEFAEAIKKVFRDASLHSSLGIEGYKLAVGRYNWQAISKNLERVLIGL